MAKPGLRSRLFLSHMAVMLVGMLMLTAISRYSSPRFFVGFLETLDDGDFSVATLRKELVSGFKSAWGQGAVWSVIAGGSAAGGLSFLLARRIMQPLIELEETTKKFAAGDLSERVPPSHIPEFNQLAASFNRMASDLEGMELRRREIITDLTHELRTPLTVVEGYLEGLADNTIQPSPEVYHLLATEATRMRRLVNDLQELSKIEAGYLPIKTQPIALPPLLGSIVQRFSEQLLHHDSLIVYVKHSPDLPLVRADAGRVEQILLNLIINALRHTAEGRICVQATQQGPWVWVSVSDTGTGIKPEDLPHIFERFWRSDRARHHQSSGTGIGLAISRRLVELQGGQIEADSQLGVGSTFRFSLPVA